jgi:hypothetical protein
MAWLGENPESNGHTRILRLDEVIHRNWGVPLVDLSPRPEGDPPQGEAKSLPQFEYCFAVRERKCAFRPTFDPNSDS